MPSYCETAGHTYRERSRECEMCGAARELPPDDALDGKTLQTLVDLGASWRIALRTHEPNLVDLWTLELVPRSYARIVAGDSQRRYIGTLRDIVRRAAAGERDDQPRETCGECDPCRFYGNGTALCSKPK